jgi:hypothetical protein
MKRNLLLTILMILTMILAVAACAATTGDDDDDDNNDPYADDDDTTGADDDDADDDDDDDADDDDDNDDGDDDDDDDDDDDGMSIADMREDHGPGDTVTVRGVVTTPTNFSDDLFFIQDEDNKAGSAGVAVYMWSEIAADYDGEMGDMVEITGELDDFFGMLELVVKNEEGSIEVVGSGSEPDPVVLAVGDLGEDYEGMLVTVEDVTATSDPDEYGAFFIEDGDGDEAMVDDTFFEKDHWGDFGVEDGSTFNSITGVLNYSHDEWRVEPRSDSDVDE